MLVIERYGGVTGRSLVTYAARGRATCANPKKEAWSMGAGFLMGVKIAVDLKSVLIDNSLQTHSTACT